MEIGSDKDYVHFLVQWVPTYTVIKIVRMLKSIMTRKIFRYCSLELSICAVLRYPAVCCRVVHCDHVG
ncbi:transposase [Candidatus Nitrotoga sp. AM1P]|uniref:transposase n=1 Tax=Candidatus Nitrotoga sp. AM1P TaxID=2559597 RepID=UPI0018E0BF58